MKSPSQEVFEFCAKADLAMRGVRHSDVHDINMRHDLQQFARTFMLAAEGSYEDRPIPLQEARNAIYDYNDPRQAGLLGVYYPHIQEAAFHLMCAANRFE